MKIGLLSDTHGYLHPRVFDFFRTCDQIWHAGDLGTVSVANQLMEFKPLTAVFGNIDGHEIRLMFPEIQLFNCEDVKVMLTHIGGYPGHYSKGIPLIINSFHPKLFITGHSHILKVIPDTKNNLLHINPGAAGKSGFHQKITFVRFHITGKDIHDLEIMEIDRNQFLTEYDQLSG